MANAAMANQSDQFDWVTDSLRGRGLQTVWRRAMFGLTATLAALPLISFWSPAGPHHPMSRAVSVIASAFGLGTAVLWLLRWPTRRQSLLSSLGCMAVVAAWCLASSPYWGFLALPMFAMCGGFIAYFHDLRYVLVNFGVFAVCEAILSFRLITATGDVALPSACVLIMTALNIGVPIGIRVIVQNLRNDLKISERDPLTGLHNRRSFYNSVHAMMTLQNGSTGTYLGIAVVDLDDFKRVNDTQGHAVGDQALVAVAAALQENCRPTAVICRSGGEEFVVADIDTTPVPAKSAERIRQAIAAIRFGVTASIGTCSVPLGNSAATKMHIIDELIRASDAAMYEAKHAGGNRVCHYRALAPPGRDLASTDQ